MFIANDDDGPQPFRSYRRRFKFESCHGKQQIQNLFNSKSLENLPYENMSTTLANISTPIKPSQLFVLCFVSTIVFRKAEKWHREEIRKQSFFEKMLVILHTNFLPVSVLFLISSV